MKRKKLPYKVGDWIAVPLQDSSGYAAGIIARADKSGGILCYFFRPKRKKIPELNKLKNLKPKDAIFVGIVGDLGLLEGKWKIIGRLEPWNQEDWPVPLFARELSLTPIGYIVEYDDQLNEVKETKCSIKEAQQYPNDVCYGYVAAESVLTEILKKGGENNIYHKVSPKF